MHPRDCFVAGEELTAAPAAGEQEIENSAFMSVSTAPEQVTRFVTDPYGSGYLMNIVDKSHKVGKTVPV